MQVFEDLEKMLETELDKIVKKGDLTPVELDNAKKAVCLMKEIQEVKEIKMDLEDGYSQRASGNNYYTVPMYYDRNSYNRGSGRRMNSQSGGRYSRDMRGRSSYDYNSYEDGRSGHSIKDRMIDKLESMMDESTSDYERQTITEWIEKLEM